jgi:hypothetical protein
MTPPAFLAAACCLALLCPASRSAQAMQPLNDSALSSVQGRDGLSFDLANFSMTGDVRLTYYAPAPSTASAYIGNPYLARSDDADAFADPYRLDVQRSPAGLADMITLAFPANANGAVLWQVAYDWGTDADGLAFEGGSMVLKDLALRGGGLQLGTPRSGDGIAFGLALRMEIGDLLLRPRGRGDIGHAEPAGVPEQMHLRGVRLGAVGADGSFTNAPWRIADLAAQPGVINAVTDAEGNPRLHIGIDWPDANGAPLGGLQIDKLSFRSDVTGNLDLGSSRIGSMQIQYLDIKLKP